MGFYMRPRPFPSYATCFRLERMNPSRLIQSYLSSNPKAVLAASLLLIAGIAFCDWIVDPNVSLGFLYIFPILFLGGSLRRWEIVPVAMTSAFLREALAPFAWEPDTFSRLVTTGITFAGAGLFITEISHTRRKSQRHLEQSREQQIRIEQAEEELRVLVETNPAAILIVDREGRAVRANEAAERLLGTSVGPLRGQMITEYLPLLGELLPGHGAGHRLRTVVEGRGRRQNGETFPAHIWVSSYETASGPRLAAIVIDASDDLRDWGDASLQALRWTSSILLGAVSHEVRNLCEAGLAAFRGLGRLPEAVATDEYRAVGAVMEGLRQISSQQLRRTREGEAGGTDALELLEDFRIIIRPSLEDLGVEAVWTFPDELPAVRGDHQSLLNILMNLAHNSLRAMNSVDRRKMAVEAMRSNGKVVVRVRDNGPGVAKPEKLFLPFQSEATGTGLGLYVSRTLVRSLGGDLEYEAAEEGACFLVELAVAE